MNKNLIVLAMKKYVNKHNLITQTSQHESHGTDESVPYEGYAQCRERIYAFRYATWFVD